jgi:uncharacterized phage protein gp47/JayE
MYEAQTESVIKQRMLDGISNTIDKLEGSFTNDAIAPVALELASLYVELDRYISLVFAQTSSGTYLDNRAGEFGVIRKQGTYSSGVVTFTGTSGTLIPKGSLVQTAGGLQFTTDNDCTITGTTIDASVTAVEVGSNYNLVSGVINQIPVQVVGVTSVTNAQPTTGGTDIETDSALLARLLLKVQTPSTSGNVNDYKLWALSVAGIGDAKVFPIWDGNGTVKVCLIDSNKQPASAELVTAVQNYIEANRPIGATVTYEAATALNINVTVTIVRDSAYSMAQVTSNITAKLTAYLQSIAFKSTYASYAQIGNAIIDSDGVLDYSGLLVNGGTANIAIGAEQVAVLGVVTVT